MIEELLREMGARLRTSARRRDRIVEEAREHLEDAVARLEREGVAPDAARRQAVTAFGEPAALAREFNAQAATAAMRYTPAAIFVYAIVVVGGFTAAAVPVGEPAHRTSASIALRVAFLVGTIGVQVAFVAGLRAASIVVARWRDPIAPARERRIVRFAAMTGAGGLTVAAASWTVAFLLALTSERLTGDRTLVAGALGLAIAAAGGLGALGVLALRPPDENDCRDATPRADVASVGELVVRVVASYPRAACTFVATAAALLAMRGAESTPLGAIPSGIAEAAAVVAAFVVLGSRLGLRGETPAGG